MSRSFFFKQSLVAVLLTVALAAGAHAQEATGDAAVRGPDATQDPLDRYERDPLPTTRLGDDTEVMHGPTEPRFQDVPDYDEDPVPPVESESEDVVPQGSGAVGSAPPAGAFAPEPNAFGPPRATFRLPSSIGAPGVEAPAKKLRVSNTPHDAAAAAAAAKNAAASVPAAAKEAFAPSVPGDDDTQADPFESSAEPAPEEWQGDRRDAREHELAVPDDYLDPAWPDDSSDSRISPEESDSVENVPLGDDVEMDQAEREETERYKEALGLNAKSDEFKQDDWGDTPADHTREKDVKEYEDPAEW